MRIARNAAASVGQVLATGLILFFLYRVNLETLGAESLGIWSVVLATASASRIGDLGLSASVTRFVARYRASGDDGGASHAVQTAAISISVLLIPVLLAAYPLLRTLFGKLFADEGLEEALLILPYALISVVPTVVAAVFQSGLDGCQRHDWRALVVLLGQLLFLFAALWLAPRYGLKGLAWAQIAQGIFLSVTGWLFLRHVLPSLPLFPYQWRREPFRKMLGYGLQFQAGSMALMLFEPLTKALVGKYGGLAAAGYFEMASQFVGKARQLIISANQVLIPVAAELYEQNTQRLFAVYRTNLRLLCFVAIPGFALVAGWGPLLSEVWIGRYEPVFVFFVIVLALSWGLNTFSAPAYFFNLGTGHIAWNTASHVWMGILNGALGLSLGPHFGAEGIAWSMAAALATGSALVIRSVHRRQNLSWRLLLPSESFGLVIAAIMLALVEYHSYHALVNEPTTLRFLAGMLLPLFILGPVVWRHPLRLFVQNQLTVFRQQKKPTE